MKTKIYLALSALFCVVALSACENKCCQKDTCTSGCAPKGCTVDRGCGY